MLRWMGRRKIEILAAAISLCGLYIRFRALKSRGLMNDEIYQFYSMCGEFKAFWLFQNYGDHSAFPGEYLLEYFFIRGFGMNKWGLAVPHILLTILGFWLLYQVGRYYFHSWAGYAVAFSVMAFNQNLVSSSFEFRPYAVLPVLSLASLFIFHRLTDPRRPWGRGKVVLSGLTSILIVNYHIYGAAAFLLPLIFLWLADFRKFARAQGYAQNLWSRVTALPGSGPFLFFVLVAGLIWCWYASFNSFGLTPNMKAQVIKETFEYIPNPCADPLSFARGVLGNLVGFKAGYFFLASVLLCAFLPCPRKFEQFVFASLLIVLPILLVLYADLRSHYWFVQRQFVWVIPFFSVFLGWQWDALYARVKQNPWVKAKN